MIWVLTVVLMGLNGPFRYTERFMDYQHCVKAQRHWQQIPEVWVGRCHQVQGSKKENKI